MQNLKFAAGHLADFAAIGDCIWINEIEWVADMLK